MADDKLQWSKTHERALQSDRAAVDIGLFGLKAALTLNGGALIAMVGLYPNVEQVRGVAFYASCLFAAGLGLGTLSALLAYFYQSLVTEAAWDEINEANGRANKWAKILRWPMVFFVILSITAFGAGTIQIVGSLSQSGQKEQVLRGYIKHYMPDLKLTDWQLKILDQYDQLTPEQRRAVVK